MITMGEKMRKIQLSEFSDLNNLACHAGNIGSQRVAEKLGFELVGECRTIQIST